MLLSAVSHPVVTYPASYYVELRWDVSHIALCCVMLYCAVFCFDVLLYVILRPALS